MKGLYCSNYVTELIQLCSFAIGGKKIKSKTMINEDSTCSGKIFFLGLRGGGVQNNI